jgi:hypothetical protein
MPANASDLSVYLEYEYLAARQLGGLLLGLHGVYDELLYADAPFLRQLPTAPAARLMSHLDAIAQVVSEESIRAVRIVLPDPPARPGS